MCVESEYWQTHQTRNPEFGQKQTASAARIGNLKNLKYLCISRNIIETLPNSISNLKQLTYIDAWDNPLYILPESIKALQKSLQTLDLRQIPLTKTEYKAMQELLPNTEILFTDICECENRRDHN